MANLKNWLPEMTKDELEWFNRCPKSVLFEIARQFRMRIADDFSYEAGFTAVRQEWDVLYQNQLVPQKPFARAAIARATGS